MTLAEQHCTFQLEIAQDKTITILENAILGQ